MSSYLAIYIANQINYGVISFEDFVNSKLAKNNPKLVKEVSALIKIK